jgi:D-alanine-D-alanine ligase
MRDMKEKFGKVAVLFGGSSAEREVSLMSGHLVLESLLRSGIDAQAFDPKDQPLSELKAQHFDRAFIALHGGSGENGTLQGALEFLAIPYTGSGVLGSALGMDKFRTKLVWQQLGIPTPPFTAIRADDDIEAKAQQALHQHELPLFVKPAGEGSSVAVTKVKTVEALVPAIREALQHDRIALVEKSIEGGGEYTCSILGDAALPIIKIEPDAEFYTYHAKYVSDNTHYLIPSGLNNENRLRSLARDAFYALGCSGYGRADFMTDADGQIYFLEVNTAPGLTSHSLVPKAAAAAGMRYDDLMLKILDQTLELRS